MDAGKISLGKSRASNRRANGPRPCKRRKIKWYVACEWHVYNIRFNQLTSRSTEEKPSCANCLRQGDTCDYSIRLNWEGRTKRKASESSPPTSTSGFVSFATNQQSSGLVSAPELTSPSDLHLGIRDEWSAASSPYTNSTGNTWIPSGSPPSVPSQSPPVASEDNQLVAAQHGISTEGTCIPSTTVHESFQTFSQPFVAPDSLGLDSIGLGFTALPYGFESNAVSQPVSFIRDTSADGLITEQGIYKPKRPRRQGDPKYHGQTSLDQDTGRMLVGLLSRGGDNTFESPDRRQPIVTGHEIFYGYDCGTPDYDLPKNNDAEAIAPINPSDEVIDEDPISPVSEPTPTSSIHVRRRSSFTTGGGYYITPVRVKIPRRMTPLPSALLENPMNLLYFHHFIDHTARILVPHDCDRNGFLNILPASKLSFL